MVKRILFVFFMSSRFVMSQDFIDLNDGELRVQFSGGLGLSMMGGLSDGFGGEFLFRLNQIGFRYNYDSEPYTSLHPNNFWHYGDSGFRRDCNEYMFYYGRSMQFNRFVPTVRLGLCKMLYKDAHYTTEYFSGDWFVDAHNIYTVYYDDKRTFGLFTEIDVNYLFLRYLGGGIRIYGNFNEVRNIGGFQAYMNFLIGPK